MPKDETLIYEGTLSHEPVAVSTGANGLVFLDIGHPDDEGAPRVGLDLTEDQAYELAAAILDALR